MTSGVFLISLVAGACLLLAAGAFRLRAASARRRARADAELEALRDEIWELRAAAAARDRAEAASLAKSRFLATVSHEIRTPLNCILGLAQLLLMTKLDAEQGSYVEAIGASGRSLAQLIDDILDFSKIEAGKLELRPEPFVLASLVEGVVELLAPRAHGKNLEIASLVAPDAPERVIGDAARVRQVLLNLAGNAVDFTERGGVGIRVAPNDRRELVFEVSDTGPGIAAQARETIFQEFEQGDASATRRHGGTGLGLAISRRLAALMGGRLEIVASSDAGTTFAFALPLGQDAFVEKTGGEPPPLRGSSALVVARTVFEAPFLASVLRSAGAGVEIADGEAPGVERLEARSASPFSAVIVDCALGEEATERLAATARAAGAGRLFLLFSPLERRAFGEAALRRFDGWLVKPVRAASLVERLSSVAPSAAETSAPSVAPVLCGLRVLLAEDNEINALIASRHLEKLGAIVTRAENGARAVEAAREAIDGRVAPFDAILMDLFMPEVDGLEAARRIHLAAARAGAPWTPILALTASAREEDARAAHAAGIDAVLTKPLDFAALGRAIEALRGGRHGLGKAVGAR